MPQKKRWSIRMKSILENLENMYLVSQHVSDYDVALTEEEQQAIKDAAAKFGEDNSDSFVYSYI